MSIAGSESPAVVSRAAPDGERGRRDARVDTRTDLSYDEFLRLYVNRRRPVVIRRAVSADGVTPDTLLAAHGDTNLASLRGGGGARTLVRGTPEARERFRSLSTLASYLTRFQDCDAGLPYLTNLGISANFPALRRELAPPAYFEPNWIGDWPFKTINQLTLKESDDDGELFIAPLGATYGVLHYDRHAVYVGTCQYYGRKMWWICGPEQSAWLYPMGAGYPHKSPVNPFNPDLDRFPLFARVEAHSVVLEPGDVLFLPSSWWHATRAVTPNISAVHRILNQHNLAAYVWQLRHYLPTLKSLGISRTR